MVQLIAALIVVCLFFGMDSFLRRSDEAKSLRAGEKDRGSTILLGLSYNVALIGGPALSYLGIGLFGPTVAWVGVVVALCGLLLRVWAMRVLGQFYTRTLLVAEGHRIVDTGPYRFIRNPGYLGSILVFTGFSLATRNWIAAAATLLLMWSAHTYRIKSEERMLLEAFGEEYRAYMQRSWRLVPLIY